jgi:hypothetical protein
MINHQLTLALKLASHDQRPSIENDGQHSLSPPVGISKLVLSPVEVFAIRNSHHIRKRLLHTTEVEGAADQQPDGYQRRNEDDRPRRYLLCNQFAFGCSLAPPEQLCGIVCRTGLNESEVRMALEELSDAVTFFNLQGQGVKLVKLVKLGAYLPKVTLDSNFFLCHELHESFD